MLILITNDDGIESPGLHALRQIGGKLAGPDGEVWVCGARAEPFGRGAFAVAQRAGAHPQGRRARVRGARHADRQRDHGRASRAEGPQARPHPVGHQPRLEPGRGRDLFGHDRGVLRGHAARHPLDRAVAGVRRRKASPRRSGRRRSRMRPSIISKLLQLEWAPGTLYSLNFPDGSPTTSPASR